jgi:hypothetical protein
MKPFPFVNKTVGDLFMRRKQAGFTYQHLAKKTGFGFHVLRRRELVPDELRRYGTAGGSFRHLARPEQAYFAGF